VVGWGDWTGRITSVNLVLYFFHRLYHHEILQPSKIYHTALVVCTPYFVKWNKKILQLECYHFLCVCVQSKMKQKLRCYSDNFTVLPSCHCHFKSSSLSSVKNVRLQHRHRLTGFYSSMTWFTAANDDTFMTSLARHCFRPILLTITIIST